MTTIIEHMLKKYDSKNMYDQKNAMKEVMQEIVLYGLSRAGFFNMVGLLYVFSMVWTGFRKIWISP